MEKYSDILKRKKNPENRFSLYMFLAILLLAVFAMFYFFTYCVTEVVVVGPSMEPTLKSGDVLYASRIREPRYNDVIVIDGEKEDEWIIKRVIGLGGDHIEITGGYVYRNGIKLEDDYLKYGYTDKLLWEAKTLEEDEIFYLGDNRPVSADSRYYFSTCMRSQVVGVVSDFWVKVKGVTAFFFYNIKMPIKNIFR